MKINFIFTIIFIFLIILFSPYAQSAIYEIDGSPFATHDAPLPEYITQRGEKIIIVDPKEHAWGAYSAQGKLMRWGIASAGSNQCRDKRASCRTKSGEFRLYSLGDAACVSSKYPFPTGGAPMPYCMYFNGGQAIHGSHETEYANVSHGCVRIHVDDAKWLRYQFVEGPNTANHYRGTKILIKNYE